MYYDFREFRRDLEEFGHWFPGLSLIETTYLNNSQLESYLRNQFIWPDTDL